MKFCRYRLTSATTSAEQFGIIEGESIRQITGTLWDGWEKTDSYFSAHDCRLLAPVIPSKIVCVGRNYAAHASELGNEIPKEPLIFLKPPSSLIGQEEPIVLPQVSQRVEHEAELAVVIGKKCRKLTNDDNALSYVFGYTCLNDVTARDLQKSDVQFTRAKGFDTFCPIGPIIETQIDPRDAVVEARVNGVLKQSGNTALMIYPVDYLVKWISGVMTLLPGDVIATGTPAGVGALVAGDIVEVSIPGVGMLRNPVQACG